MSTSAFPPHVSAALDRLNVPPLPEGFADRLLARIEAGDLPAEGPAPFPPSPVARWRFGGKGWRRSGGIVAVAATFSLATATAAASGFFGEPVYVPVVSDALAKAKLVVLPERQSIQNEAKPLAAEGTVETPKSESPPTANGREAVRNLYQRLRSDPGYRALSRQERIAIARQEIRSLLQSGAVTLPELQRALAEHRLHASPAMRPRMRRQPGLSDMPQRAATEGSMPATGPGAAIAPPAQAQLAARRAAFRTLDAAQQARIIELRRQLRTATPAVRIAIRRELQSIWQSVGTDPVDGDSDTVSDGKDIVAP